MSNAISCEKCGRKVTSKHEVITRSDGSKWLHYDCEAGHAFHRTPAGDPVQFVECDCREAN